MNNFSQIETTKIRSRTVLLCPDNDTEAHLILKLAEKAGIGICPDISTDISLGSVCWRIRKNWHEAYLNGCGYKAY